MVKVWVKRHRRNGKPVKGHWKDIKRTRYTTSKGTFKEMTNPSKPGKKKSKFYGCERSMLSRGYSPESSKKICGAIKYKKR